MATRQSILRKSYVYPDGTSSRSAKPGWSALNFDVFSGFKPAADADAKPEPIVGKSISVARDTLSKVFDQALGHGFMQKIGDEIAGWQKKAEKAEEKADWTFVVRTIEDMVDTLVGGIWVAEGEGTSAGNVTLLYQAVIAAYEEAGKPLSEEAQKNLLVTLQDKAQREGIKKVPRIAAHLARLTAERATARAAEAAKSAEGHGLDALDTFLSGGQSSEDDASDEEPEEGNEEDEGDDANE